MVNFQQIPIFKNKFPKLYITVGSFTYFKNGKIIKIELLKMQSGEILPYIKK